jgi:hypothetical protein
MGRPVDYVRKKFAPMLDKTLKRALAHRIGKEFPRLGGARIRTLCAEMILEVVNQHIRPRDTICHGQVLWTAVSLNDPPARMKRIADTDLVPVVLDLSTPDDIQAIIGRVPAGQRLLQKATRLCHQAHSQGALLSNCDLAELLAVGDSHIAHLLCQYERQSGKLVPRRTTLHDVGSGLTHKRIICWKRYAEGKSQDQIARETRHSLEAVDRYLGQFDRVRHCRQQGLSPAETAFALGCSLALVNQYFDIDDLLKGKPRSAGYNSDSQTN